MRAAPLNIENANVLISGIIPDLARFILGYLLAARDATK
jgi:hypothetical protein